MITSNAQLRLDSFDKTPGTEEKFTSIRAPLEQQFPCSEHMKNFFHNYFEKFPHEESFLMNQTHISFKLIKNLMNHAIDIWNILKIQTDQTHPSLGDVLIYASCLEDRLKSYLYKIDQAIQGLLINKMVPKDIVGNIKLAKQEGASFEKKTEAHHFYVQFATDNIAHFLEMYKESKVAKIRHLHVLSEVDIETIKERIKIIPVPVLFMGITFLKDSKENILVDSIKLRF